MFEVIGDVHSVFGINEQVDSLVSQLEMLTQKINREEVNNLSKSVNFFVKIVLKAKLIA